MSAAARPESALRGERGERPGDAARARLRGVRSTLRAIVVLRAVLWGAAAAAVVAALRAASGGAGSVWDAAVVGAGVAAAAGALWRAAPRGVSLERAALWVEARVPSLRYALVTLADPHAAVPDDAARALDAVVRGARWGDAVRGAAARSLGVPLAVLLAALALGRAAADGPLGTRARGTGPAARGAAAVAAVDRLARVRATVTPPAYSGLPAQRVDDPSAVEALEGSAVVVEGDGDAAGLAARVAADTGAGAALRPADAGGRWRVSFTMPARPAALRLDAGGRTRLVVLAPRLDAPPRVSLSLPARDTVLRTPAGTLPLAATADDDLGLAGAQFEWIVSSGEGESFTFRSGVIGRASLGGARRASPRGALSVEGLALKPGDLVHLRATARDRNPAAGRAPGASETRTIRVARAGEYDSVAVEAAPPAMGDTSQIGQRMLLQLTEALVKRQRSIARPVLMNESRRIAQDQARLRKRVGDLVFQRLGESEAEHAHTEGDGHGSHERMTPEQLLAAASAATGVDPNSLESEGDETPIVALNKPLLEAYNHMWDAGRALEIGEPSRAIPPMRLAIAALQRARAAERIYLRGRPPVAVVDLAKVRLAARLSADTMNLAPRAPRPPLDARTRARAGSVARAVALLARDAGAAADTLALLRVDALGDAPALAAALGEASDALRRGRDATAALVRARRLAAGAPARADSVAGWAW